MFLFSLEILREPLSASDDSGGRRDAEFVRSSSVLPRECNISGLSKKIKTQILMFSPLPLTPMSGMVIPSRDEYSTYRELPGLIGRRENPIL
jgi:hypothetical protein